MRKMFKAVYPIEKTGRCQQQQKLLHSIFFNGEREISGRQKVVRWSNVPVLISYVGLNPRSKSGYEREARVIKKIITHPQCRQKMPAFFLEGVAV